MFWNNNLASTIIQPSVKQLIVNNQFSSSPPPPPPHRALVGGQSGVTPQQLSLKRHLLSLKSVSLSVSPRHSSSASLLPRKYTVLITGIVSMSIGYRDKPSALPCFVSGQCCNSYEYSERCSIQRATWPCGFLKVCNHFNA